MLLLLVGEAGVAAAQGLPKGTKPLSAVEMYMIYRDKTWLWKNGAGRFFSEGRKFLAWTSDDEGQAVADGRYVLTNDGRMCIVAVWTGETYSKLVKTCFLHRKDRGTIYQKREDAGGWHLFRSFEPAETDEAKKLIESDEVSRRTAEITEALKSRKPAKGER